MRMLIVLTALAGTVLLAPAASTSKPALDRGTLTVKGSRFGRVLFDGRGYALYAFTADGRNRATCRGACASAWPPLVVKARPHAGTGAQSRLLGVTRREDGRLQATYAGKPLYYYIGDRQPGRILCQNVNEFGGLWLVVRPHGGYVR
jgi:predicted lipoprotein with Yx(FWY)xxD motif